MKTKCFIFLVIVTFVMLLYAPIVLATSILGTAGETFAVLGHEAVTNVPTSTIVGNVGVSPGVAISGFNSSPGLAVADPQVTGGLVHATTALAGQALSDANIAYTGLANMLFAPANDFTGTPTLGGRILPSGVYHFGVAADLTGTLTLDAEFNNNAYWVFQIGTALTTASSSVVQVINLGTNGGIDDGVFWQIGSDATLGGSTEFEGNILAHGSATLITAATDLNGRVFALTGAVTLGDNTISIVCPPGPPGNGGPGYSGGLYYDSPGHILPIGPSQGPTPIPEPATMLLLGSGLVGLAGFARRKFKK